MTSEQRAILATMIGLSDDARDVAALTVALGTCGNCRFASADMAPLRLVHCTLAEWHYNGKLMTSQSRCEKWSEAQP